MVENKYVGSWIVSEAVEIGAMSAYSSDRKEKVLCFVVCSCQKGSKMTLRGAGSLFPSLDSRKLTPTSQSEYLKADDPLYF